jgi:acetyl esterase/lipase
MRTMIFRFPRLLLARLFFSMGALFSIAQAGAGLVRNLEADKPQTVVTYGTSLTAGGAWVGQFGAALEARWPGRAKVVNSGQGGMWSKWGVDNLDGRVIAKKPDTVLIEFGINDAYLEYKTPVAAARANLETMIDRILAAKADTEIILMTMNPPVGVHLERRPAIAEYYEMYRSVAKERKLQLIDHAANWAPILANDRARFDRYVPDGIHPGPEGCREVITPALLKALGIPAVAAEPEKVSLWPEQAPLGDGNFEKAEVFITVHRAEKPNGAAMVICPGGGYGGLVVGPEGHGIAKWLNGHGIAGIVLEYRLPKGRSAVPLLDAQRAIRTVRAKAKEWSIDSAKVGIIGFSAGGHLAATAAAAGFDNGNVEADDLVERQSSRPDFAVLVYPVITMGEGAHGGSRKNLLGPKPTHEEIHLFSAENLVSERSAPTYLTHAVNDRIVPVSHSRSFHAALEEKKVPTEYLELPSGDHGLDGYKGPMWDAWQAGVLKWLTTRGVAR